MGRSQLAWTPNEWGRRATRRMVTPWTVPDMVDRPALG
jgi:hypothetical protein